MNLIKAVARGAWMGAVAYGGFAAYSYLRYGKPRKMQPKSALDRYMPRPEIIERHCIGVNAPTDVAYEACCAYDIGKSKVAQLLFDTRARAMGIRPVHKATQARLVDQMKAMGWTVLEEAPGREIIFGAGAKPWVADAGFRTISARKFEDFDEPEWVKIVVSFTVEPAAGCCSLVSTETRAVATDTVARKRFRKYWSFVSPGVKLIRIAALRAIKSDAETHVRKELKKAASAA